MIDYSKPHLVVPREYKLSFLRRLFKRTLYLRLLDGEFILWCFETGRTARHESDLLRHVHVIISDTQAFKTVLLKAMNEVGVGSLPGRRRLLILHCLRFLPGGLAPTEKYSLYEMWKNLGNEFFLYNPEQAADATDLGIVELCEEIGAFGRKLKKIAAKS